MYRPLIIIFLASLLSCKAYKQDIMFKLDDNFTAGNLAEAVSAAEDNYRIQKSDLLSLSLYTNKGERIIDPNFELQQDNLARNQRNIDEVFYLVRENGMVKLPMVGDVELTGLTIYEAEKKLQQLYSNFYIEPFVVLRFENKRVFVLGASGGQVVPLVNENTSLIEVIALAGGIGEGAKSHNIRVIRGNMENPSVFMVDLSTISGMRASMLQVEPGDIIYIEPWRRVWVESLRDLTPVLSLVSSVITLALVIQNLGSLE